MLFAVIHAAQQRLDRAPLVSLRLVGGNEIEIHKRSLSSWPFVRGRYHPQSQLTGKPGYPPHISAARKHGPVAARNNLFYRWEIQKCVDVPSIERSRFRLGFLADSTSYTASVVKFSRP